MAIGPVQMLVIGFDEPNFTGAIRDELARLRLSRRQIDRAEPWREIGHGFGLAREHVHALHAEEAELVRRLGGIARSTE